jgi:hypothetical protein
VTILRSRHSNQSTTIDEKIALYDGATIQLDAISMDSSLHTSADDQFFRDDVTLNLCAVVDQNG